MDTSLWEDEAQLANMFLEEESNRSSSETCSPGFHFNSTFNLKKNLASSFDKELPTKSKHVENTFCTSKSEDQSSWERPPLPTEFGTKPSKSKKRFAVYLRIRPLSSNSSEKISQKQSKGASTIEILEPPSNSKNQANFPKTIRTYPPNLSNAYKMNINRQARDNSTYAKEFNFDRVMDQETSQEDVYAAVAAPLFQDLLSPVSSSSTSRPSQLSALLFSYGITNAGKTHTILGEMNPINQANWGIIPRTINDIFQRKIIQSASEGSANNTHFEKRNKSVDEESPCTLYMSFFEIYNENIYDLMPRKASNASKNMNMPPPALKVRECRGQTIVRGLTKHRINSVTQGIELTKQAHKKRHTSSNNLNSDSSRSHFVCQIQIVPKIQKAATYLDREFVAKGKEDKGVHSQNFANGYSTDEEASDRSKTGASTIWIVDLAGSERSKRTGVGSTRQKESTKINNSLVTLMRCLNAMKKDGKKGLGKSVIPFRDSKLTHIFMSHLTSKSAARTAMMVNVNPSAEDFDETQHVLSYSRKAKLIEINMNEHKMKRKEFSGEEYDRNGRKKPRIGGNKHPPNGTVSNRPKNNLLSRIVKKLSPKKDTAKMPLICESEKDKTMYTEDCSFSKEIETLKNSLQDANEKINILENQNRQLLGELDSKEDQIRYEVSLEMEKRLRETRNKHNEKFENLRSRITSKAAIAVSMNRAGVQLEELMDKIDECEKENLRMSREHQQRVISLNNEIDELKRKDKLAAEQKAEDLNKIYSLEEALKKSNEEIIRLKDIQEPGAEGTGVIIAAKKEIKNTESSKFKRKLRPRKPFENSTNRTVFL